MTGFECFTHLEEELNNFLSRLLLPLWSKTWSKVFRTLEDRSHRKHYTLLNEYTLFGKIWMILQ